MKITRNNILRAIVGRSQFFPNCHLKRIRDELEITLLNSKGEIAWVFKADVSGKSKDKNTYYDTYEYLLNHPEIKLVEEPKKERKIIEV